MPGPCHLNVLFDLSGQLFERFLRILVHVCFPFRAEAIVVAKTRDQMNMEMIDGLTGDFLGVGQNVHPDGAGLTLNRVRDFRDGLKHVRRNVFRELIDVSGVVFWNDERMSVRHLRDVEESDDVIVFVHFVRRDLVVDDFTKNTVVFCVHGTSSILK